MLSIRTAVFPVLLLGFCACGGGTSTPPPPPAPPTPVTVPAAWTSYVQAQAKPIQSLDLTHGDDSDLAFLGPLLQGRRLLALGESGHGVAEFSQVKIRLIKYLHEQQGYDVLAFESSLLGCYLADEQAGQLDSKGLMQDSIFGVWSTEDVVKLFAYIQATRATAHPLILAGFDIQLSSITETLARPGLFQEVVGKVDPGYAQQVHDMDVAFLRNFSTPSYLKAQGADLLAKYQALTTFLDAHMAQLQAAYPDRPLLPMAVRQAAWGTGPHLRDLIDVLVLNDVVSGLQERDAGMAANVGLLLDTMYPGKKVIAWAHNGHIAHNGDLEEGWKNMGQWLAERYGTQIYTVGLFMYQGSEAMNDRSLKTIAPAPAYSLEGLLHTTRQPCTFIDLSQASPAEGSAWMFQDLPARDWGYQMLEFVPKDQYDGILLVDTVRAPVYVD